MSVLGFGGTKIKNIGNEYAPGKFFNPENSYLSGSYQDLYDKKANLNSTYDGGLIARVDTDHASLNLTPEQQQAITNNQNLKDTQDRLKKQGAGIQQSVLGGRGY